MVSWPLDDWPFDGIQMTEDAASKDCTFESGAGSGSVIFKETGMMESLGNRLNCSQKWNRC